MISWAKESSTLEPPGGTSNPRGVFGRVEPVRAGPPRNLIGARIVGVFTRFSELPFEFWRPDRVIV